MYRITFKNGQEKCFDTLVGADLRYADLRYADLVGADLRGACLRYASLRDANLRGANLRGADLRYADLRDASLEGVSLRGVSLEGADLRYADLRYADLRGVSLEGVSLEGVKGIITFQIEAHLAIYYKHGESYRIMIGCQDHTLDHWLENYSNIGKLSNYTKDQIEVYGAFIKLCSMYEIS